MSTPQVPPPGTPDPEVPPKGRRRSFSKEEKLRVLTEADQCTRPGEVGALLRRHGIYSSHLAAWRKQRSQGTLSDAKASSRGPRPSAPSPIDSRVLELERENRLLQRKLKQAEIIIDIQKKASALLGIPLRPRPKGGRG
ncbi:MAG: transposase [Planctomycetes bacterium]|nr:transposase [Planctomycetota bacterium]